MQKRHLDRKQYFQESAYTSKAYYINYIRAYKDIKKNDRVLEIGCGEGGNLLPFAELGCTVVGLDLCQVRIQQAQQFFIDSGVEGTFLCGDFLKTSSLEKYSFDIILIHDVIEHIEKPYKMDFFIKVKSFLKKDGVIFWGFPAWQMPFGGHQQICSSFCSKIPFVHLLPTCIYKQYLKCFRENSLCIEELLSIKRARMTVERFEELCQVTGYKVINRTLWFINPHYEKKFNLRAIKLNRVAHLRYIRNFFSTSCFYLVQVDVARSSSSLIFPREKT